MAAVSASPISSPVFVDITTSVSSGASSEVPTSCEDIRILYDAYDIDYRDPHSRDSLLHLAVEYGCLDWVEFLLMQGVDVKLDNDRGNLALHTAAENKDAKAVAAIARHMRENRISLDQVNCHGLTAMHIAASNNDVKTMRCLLENHAFVDVQFERSFFDTPLHRAVSLGHGAAIDILKEAGANCAVQNGEGDTPLHLAILNGNVACFGSLSSPEVWMCCNDEGLTPLRLAFELKNTAVVLALIQAGAPLCREDVPFYWAILSGSQELVAAVLARCEELVETDHGSGNQALHLAAVFANANAAALIARHMWVEGKSLDRVNRQGLTAMHIATANDDWETMGYLLINHAFVDVQHAESFFSTPLHLAASCGYDTAIHILREAGANCALQNSAGDTPLHQAILGGHTECFGKLISPDVWTQKNKIGCTPLQLAFALGNIEIILELIHAGAPICDGNHLLSLAIRLGSKELVEVLLAKMEGLWDEGEKRVFLRSSYMLAKQLGYDDIAALFEKDEEVDLFHAASDLCRIAGIEEEMVVLSERRSLIIGNVVPIIKKCIELFSEEDEEIRNGFVLATNILKNKDKIVEAIHKGELVVIPTGWLLHSLCVVIRGSVMIICNRGERSLGISSIKCYRIDPSRFDEMIIMNMDKLSQWSRGLVEPYLYHTLPYALSSVGYIVDGSKCALCAKIELLVAPKNQVHPNCSAASVKTAVRAAFVLKTCAQMRVIEDSELLKAKEKSKRFSTALRAKAESDFLKVYAGKKDDTALSLFSRSYSKTKKRMEREMVAALLAKFA